MKVFVLCVCVSVCTHMYDTYIYEVPSKFALIEYVLGCASDVGFCMKPPKTIGDSLT